MAEQRAGGPQTPSASPAGFCFATERFRRRSFRRGYRWLKPKLIAEIALRGWADDGKLHHASCKGLRRAYARMRAKLRPIDCLSLASCRLLRAPLPREDTHRAGAGNRSRPALPLRRFH
ncbi:ATP dependent DNA ligase [Bosea sp. MMO-172]|uniref:ATP dependent DNA ligase n=1 Tax=Bosea sp. MMO-172 TaxID=3127885 RepID=UPI003FA585FE